MAQLPKTTPTLLDPAMMAFRAGDLAGARLLVEAVLQDDPLHIEARFMLARFWLQGGDLTQGRRELEVLVKQVPNHVPGHILLGQLLGRLGEAKRGRQHLDHALSLNKLNPDAWLQAALIDEQLDDLPRAVSRLQRARQALPKHAAILSSLGAALAKSGDKPGAREALEAALAIDDRLAVAQFNLGLLLEEAGEAEAAVQRYRRAVQLKPDLADAHHNLGHLLINLHRPAEAMEAFRATARLRFMPGVEVPRNQRLFQRTTAAKLRHDVEQLRYLQAQDLLGGEVTQVITDHEAVLASLPQPVAGEVSVDLPPDALARLAPSYNRLLQWDAGAALPGPAVNPSLDWKAIEQGYHQHVPGIASFDGLLTDEALTALRRFCMNSTMWNEFSYSNGYVGAMIEGGFCCPLLFQIADELAAAMPTVFAGHPISMMWAFKYDHRLSGIPIHADFAAVNVNFWLTPDDANLDPDGGGLKVWDKEAPLDWDFKTYNNNEPAIRQFLHESNAQMIDVPHRQNRVVMFNSDLFHETGSLNFREGYENRRINVTMLFGHRHTAPARASS